MKILIAICALSCGMVSSARSLEDDYSYASDIMAMVETSSEWSDCIDDVSATNQIDVLYPTVESLFACQMPSDSCAFGWTREERQRSFDSFLMAFSTTNTTLLSRRDEHTGFIALSCCLEKKYTNSLPSAANIVRSQSSPYVCVAMEILLDMHVPDEEMNSLVLSMATNRLAATSYDRRLAVSSYVRILTGNEVEQAVRTNAARMFYSNMRHIENLVDVDRLLDTTFLQYATSSNRMELCRTAFAREGLAGSAHSYFSSVTNRLELAPKPLPEVEALRGL